VFVTFFFSWVYIYRKCVIMKPLFFCATIWTMNVIIVTSTWFLNNEVFHSFRFLVRYIFFLYIFFWIFYFQLFRLSDLHDGQTMNFCVEQVSAQEFLYRRIMTKNWCFGVTNCSFFFRLLFITIVSTIATCLKHFSKSIIRCFVEWLVYSYIAASYIGNIVEKMMIICNKKELTDCIGEFSFSSNMLHRILIMRYRLKVDCLLRFQTFNTSFMYVWSRRFFLQLARFVHSLELSLLLQGRTTVDGQGRLQNVQLKVYIWLASCTLNNYIMFFLFTYMFGFY
jgi:hypothetical protein